jgi:hypothetical protein
VPEHIRAAVLPRLDDHIEGVLAEFADWCGGRRERGRADG